MRDPRGAEGEANGEILSERSRRGRLLVKVQGRKEEEERNNSECGEMEEKDHDLVFHTLVMVFRVRHRQRHII